jgi:hypothetical protein
MHKDPIVDEVRKVRHEQAQKYNFDLEEIFAQAIRRQKESSYPTASFIKAKKSDQRKLREQ